MGFTKSKSRKCPVCVGCTDPKVMEIDAALKPLLADVKATGEVPKAIDRRFNDIAHLVGISPYSLRYHLKECLLDHEIQDQRLVELKDIISAISTAKHEYLSNPSVHTATAYTSLMNTFRALAGDIEGQQDPEVTVDYIIQNVMNPVSRRSLAALAEELRNLRTSLLEIVPRNHSTYIRTQIDGAVKRISSALAMSLDEGLKNLTSYYKIELEAQTRKRALESGVSLAEDEEAPLAAQSKSSEDEDVVPH